MSLWIVLPLLALWTLWAMPVRAGFLKTPGAPPRVGVAAGPFRRQAALSLAARDGRLALRLRTASGERLLPLMRKKERAADARAALAARRFLLRRLRAERLDADLAVSAGDARDTVLMAALLSAALGALRVLRPNLPLNARVACVFGRSGSARLMGIFSARAGDIMLAALLYGREYCVGRIRAWRSIPLKTS